MPVDRFGHLDASPSLRIDLIVDRSFYDIICSIRPSHSSLVVPHGKSALFFFLFLHTMSEAALELAPTPTKAQQSRR